MANKEYKEKSIPLNSNRKLINAVKKAGLTTYHPLGEWNGYGYKKLPLAVKITSISEMRKFNKIKKEVDALPKKPKKKTITEEEKILRWAKRLVKLTTDEYDLTLEEALEIAWEKLDYKDKQISDLEERQSERYSVQREKLINKIDRSNPLRRIVDKNHAERILTAHHRHSCTNYDDYLKEAHELEAEGFIDKGNAKEYAHDHLNGNYWI